MILHIFIHRCNLKISKSVDVSQCYSLRQLFARARVCVCECETVHGRSVTSNLFFNDRIGKGGGERRSSEYSFETIRHTSKCASILVRGLPVDRDLPVAHPCSGVSSPREDVVD